MEWNLTKQRLKKQMYDNCKQMYDIWTKKQSFLSVTKTPPGPEGPWRTYFLRLRIGQWVFDRCENLKKYNSNLIWWWKSMSNHVLRMIFAFLLGKLMVSICDDCVSGRNDVINLNHQNIVDLSIYPSPNGRYGPMIWKRVRGNAPIRKECFIMTMSCRFDFYGQKNINK